MKHDSERNLLLGFLALQNDFISREEFLAAVGEWLRDRSVSLDEVLRRREALPEREQELLAALVEAHLARHGGDPRRSLAALQPAGSECEELQSMAGPDLAASLAHVPGAAAAPAADAGSAFLDSLDIQLADAAGGTRGAGEERRAGESRFQILRPHARGGLGEVSVARDTELNREVALKEIQARRADDAESRARFVMEAEITGRLEHPGIVPVYALGAYRDGRPFYAMRFIRGDSLSAAIKDYHDDDAPPPRKRLRFRALLKHFVDVCHALSYAHSRGVLHRDLKPDNIMLGRFGETLVVDWGLAKTVDSESTSLPPNTTAESLLQPASGSGSDATLNGTAIGTPGYMSPEQAAGRIDELGPRTDVYSMGATLYHILTGHSSQRRKDLATLLADIRDGRFPPPRESNPEVPRALEAICLRAMAGAPSERYARVADLATDVECWLADEPVAAWQEPLTTRARRWIRRHPTLVATAATLVVATLVGLVAFSTVVAAQKREVEQKNVALRQARETLDGKNAELEVSNEALVAAEAMARDEAATATAVSDFLRGILEETDPLAVSGRLFGASSGGTERSLRSVVAAGTEQLESSFRDRPVVRALLLHTLGNIWLSFGEFETAEPMLNESRSIRERLLPAGHPDRIESTNLGGRLAFCRGRFRESRDLLEQALGQCRALLVDLPDGPDRVRAESLLSDICLDLAVGFTATTGLEDLDRALPLYAESLEIRKRLFGAESRQACMALMGLAQVHFLREDKIRGIAYLQQAVKLLDQLRGGRVFEKAAQSLLQAQLMQRFGRHDAAEAAYRECLQVAADALGEDNILVSFVQRQLAHLLYWDKEDRAAALQLWQQLHTTYVNAFGPQNRVVAEALVYLCRCQRELENHRAAADYGWQAIEIYLAQPACDLEAFATALDVWQSVLLKHAILEFKQDNVVLGRAWQRAEAGMAEVLRILPPRMTEPNQRADELSARSTATLQGYREQREFALEHALDDLDKVLAMELPSRRAFLDLRARMLAGRGQFADAITAVTELRKLDGLHGAYLYNAAGVLAQCAAGAAAGGGERQGLIEDALACLTDAFEAGFDDLELVRQDPDLQPLRGEPAYAALVAERSVAEAPPTGTKR